MSVQTNQYLMYGVKLPYQFSKDWEKRNPDQDFYDNFEEFIDDSAFDNKINHKDGIFCLFDGMSGKYIIIGHVLLKTDEYGGIGSDGPISIESLYLTDLEKELIVNSVERNFGINNEKFNYWFVTHYR